ncbi:MAG: hypothetical protein NC395_03590 [Prevotella sp.]|nr:hypothetical protein [Prevotella sp.]
MKSCKTIHIRLSDLEYENLTIAAERCGMNVSSLVRKTISEKICDPEQPDLAANREMMREFSIMCNAINEVTDKVGNDYPQICGILAEEAGKICQFLR